MDRMCSCCSTTTVQPKSSPCVVKIYSHYQTEREDKELLKSTVSTLTDKVKELENECLQRQSNELIVKKKITDLELAMQTQAKFFEDERIKLLNIVESLKASFESLKKENCSLQASQDVLTQQLADLKPTKLDQTSASPISKEAKHLPSKSSKHVLKKVSQFTTYSLHKDQKYSKKPNSTGTFISSKFSSTYSNPLFQKESSVWKQTKRASFNSTQPKSFKYSFKKLFELAPRYLRSSVQKVNDFVRPSPNDFTSPLIPCTLFRYETPSFISKWNSTSLDRIDTTYKWFLRTSNTIGLTLKWVPKVVLK